MFYDDYHYLHTKRRFKERFDYDLSLSEYLEMSSWCKNGLYPIKHGFKPTQKQHHRVLTKYLDRFKNGNQIHSIRTPSVGRKFFLVYNPKKECVVTVLDPEEILKSSRGAWIILVKKKSPKWLKVDTPSNPT